MEKRLGSCSKCSKDVIAKKHGGLRCIRCDSWWHNLCAGVDRSEIEKYKKTFWCCKNCEHVYSQKHHTIIPGRQSNKKKSQPVSTTQSPVGDRQSQEAQCGCSCKALITNLMKVDARINDLSIRLAELEQQQDSLHGDYQDSLKKLVSDVGALNKAMIDGGNARPAGKLKNDLNDIVISNIPELKNEDHLSMASLILTKIDPSLSTDSIKSAVRFQSKFGPRYLKVKVSSRAVKETLLKISRKRKFLLKDLDILPSLKTISGNSMPKWHDQEMAKKLFDDATVFINEAMSKSTRQVFLASLRLKKEGVLTSVWTFRNKVYYKTSQTDAASKCDTIQQLPGNEEVAGKESGESAPVC